MKHSRYLKGLVFILVIAMAVPFVLAGCNPAPDPEPEVKAVNLLEGSWNDEDEMVTGGLPGTGNKLNNLTFDKPLERKYSYLSRSLTADKIDKSFMTLKVKFKQEVAIGSCVNNILFKFVSTGEGSGQNKSTEFEIWVYPEEARKEYISGGFVSYDISLAQTAEAFRDGISQLLIFPFPNQHDIRGSFSFTELTLTEAAAETNVIPEAYDIDKYNGTGTTFKVDKWRDYNTRDYVVVPMYSVDPALEKTARYHQIRYTKTDEYTALAASFTGNISEFRYVAYILQGEAGSSVMLKTTAFDGANVVNCEKSYVFDGTKQILTLDLNSAPDTFKPEKITMAQLIADPGNMTSSGRINIYSCYFTNTDECDVDTNALSKWDTGRAFNFNDYWKGEGYTAAPPANGKVAVTYNIAASAEAPAVKTKLAGNFREFNYAVVSIEADETNKGKAIRLEAAGVKETFTMAKGANTFVLDLSGKDLSALSEILICAEPGKATAKTGAFTIIAAQLLKDVALIYPGGGQVEDLIVDLGTVEWFGDTGQYTLTYTAGEGLKAVWGDTKGEWANLQLRMAGNFSDYSAVEIVIKGGAVDSAILPKLEGIGFGKEYRDTDKTDPEKPVEVFYKIAKDGTTTMTLEFSKLGDPAPSANLLRQLVLFANPGESKAGSFTIESITFIV